MEHYSWKTGVVLSELLVKSPEIPSHVARFFITYKNIKIVNYKKALKVAIDRTILVCLPACLYVSLFVCLSVCLSACQSVFLSACQSVCLLVSLSGCRSVCLPVSWSVCLSLGLSACRSVCLSLCLFTFLVTVSVTPTKLQIFCPRSLRTTPDHWLKIKHFYVFGFSVFQLFLFGYLWSFNSHVFVRFAWEEINSADTCKTRVVPDGCYYKGSDSCNYIFLYVLNSALPINMCYCQKWKHDISISCKPFF